MLPNNKLSPIPPEYQSYPRSIKYLARGVDNPNRNHSAAAEFQALTNLASTISYPKGIHKQHPTRVKLTRTVTIVLLRGKRALTNLPITNGIQEVAKKTAPSGEAQLTRSVTITLPNTPRLLPVSHVTIVEETVVHGRPVREVAPILLLHRQAQAVRRGVPEHRLLSNTPQIGGEI